MRELVYKITDKMEGKKIGLILRHDIQLSASIITNLKNQDNGILINNKEVFTNYIPEVGDVLKLSLNDKRSPNIIAKDIDIDIIYEDEDIIAVNKSGDMPTHPSLNHYEDTLANGVMNYFKEKDFTFRAITRLDRETSGVVLIAKNQFSAHFLSADMKSSKIKKEYIAVVNGKPKEEEGVIEQFIARKNNSAILRCIDENGKYAKTIYEVLKSSNGLSLIKLLPITGRTHQLRVHMAYLGCPIYGDDLYGAQQIKCRTMLHCKAVSFTHPISKKGMTLFAKVPIEFENLL